MGFLTLMEVSHGSQIPDFGRSIAASGDQTSAIRAERHAADKAPVTPEAADQLSGLAVPDFHGAVLGPGGNPPAIVVGAERHGVDLPAVSPEGMKFAAVLHIPDLDRVFRAPGGQAPAVGAEGHVQTRSGDARANGEARLL